MATKAASTIVAKEPQLPRDLPGVVVVEFPLGLVRLDEFEAALLLKFDEYQSNTKHMAGAVLITAWQTSERANIGALVIDNPHAAVPLSRLPWRAIQNLGP